MAEFNIPYESNEFDEQDQRPDSGNETPGVNFDFTPRPHDDENGDPMTAYMSALGEIHTSPMTAPDPGTDTGAEIFDAEIAWFDDDHPDAEIYEQPQMFEDLSAEEVVASHAERGTVFLEFREPFDGMQREIPLAEQKAAGAALSDFGAECLEGFSIQPHEKFELRHRVINGNSNVAISIISDDSSGRDPQFAQEIVLTEIASNGPGTGERVSYHVGDDEVARRLDIRPASGDERQAFGMSNLSLEEYQALPPEGREIYDQVNRERNEALMRNIDTEESFGLRNQPVGLDEITKLIAWVRKRMRS